jgi:hypothetical protein
MIEESGSKRRSVQDGRSANIGVQTFAAQHMAVSMLPGPEPILLMTGRRRTRKNGKSTE